MLHSIRLSSDDHYYFMAITSLAWKTYIKDIPCHDKYWSEDIFVVDRAWK